uniref:Cystatin kininogen-type domain-containing protein n=1 Tax=Esox lucius TaxID=8010 RepID=A0A3P8Y0K9_ESOLU
MKHRVRLCVLVVLVLQLCAPGKGQELNPDEVLLFCDDKDVEGAVNLALLKFNNKLPNGNQLALYQILGATKAQSDSGTQYFVQFNSRVTDCPAEEKKAWKDCDYLPSGNKVPSLCNATVHMSEKDTNVQAVYCDPGEAPVVFEHRKCLGCPEDIDVDNEDLKAPVTYSIAKFNAESVSSHHFVLNSISTASRQVIAGLRYRLTFDMWKSNCSKAEHKELSDECLPNNQDVELAYCNSTVDVAPWRHETAQANLECDQGPVPSILRRRPPGWSPLRNIHNFAEVTPVPTAAVKDSSEESQERSPTASTNPALPSVAPTSAENPFHCPSKPWKQFVPPTTPNIVQEETTASPADNFTDSDLVGGK